MKLSKNFTLAEFERSQTAARKGIDNKIPADLIHNVQRLVETLLQPIRDQLGPVAISSGYRCPALNKAVGGSATSGHMKGLAADFNISGMDPYEVCCAILESGLPYDQLIAEFSEWVHISVHEAGKAPRKQALTIDRHGTRPGILEARP